MRALLPLLAVAALARALPAPPDPPRPHQPPRASPLWPPRSPHTLLVLRDACSAADPGLFSQQNLSALTSRLTQSVHVLGYDDTCGPGWQGKVIRSSLARLSDGGAVAAAGWLGASVCSAVSTSARALQRPQPAACIINTARAASVRQLATRLSWRRLLLPPAPAASECEPALRDITRALATSELTVHRAQLTPDETRHPQVVILCASCRSERRLSASVVAMAGVAPVVLLLHVEEPEPAPPAPSTLARLDSTDDAFRSSNITLDLGKSPYLRRKENSSAPTIANLSSDYPRLYKKSFPSPAAAAPVNNTGAPYRSPASRYGAGAPPYPTPANILRKEIDVNTIKKDIADGVENLLRSNISRPVSTAAKQNVSRNKLEDEQYIISRQGRHRRNSADDGLSHNNEFQRDRLESLLSQLDETSLGRILLLTNKHIDGNRSSATTDVYDDIFDAMNQQIEAERTRIETVRTLFYLYERSFENMGTNWKRIAVLSSVSTRRLDEFEEWNTTIEFLNTTTDFEEWSEERSFTEEEDSIPAAAIPALATSVVLALTLAAVLALAARMVATRRRRKRRRGDAVLLASDFTFPADERRRVGEGMETMLSCWLQQLHEFGGPELERPDLLKQPPRVATRAPSAPSSTCSVNRVVVDRRTRYKGDAVHVKYLPVSGAVELKRKATDVLLVMQSLRHENLNPFIGCLWEVRPLLVFDYCGRGSLEDVLMADDIKLDWTFRLSLLTDLVKGMRYLHASPLRIHGRLSSRNCVVDSRWVLRVTDYGLPSFYRAQALPVTQRSPRELLWTAPELLREGRGSGRGSQPGDVFSFAIIMQEVIVRGEPYCMLSLTPEEIIDKVTRPPPLIRPSVSMGAAPPEAVSVMRQCWSELPDLRPDFHRLHDIFRHLHRGRKINIVDSMFEMLEKYSNNLEELIKDRTDQLDMEKKKTEQLLNRMLPRSVAERLMLGSRVEPEEFEEVSIYFSDIVGFTSLAARSTPVQVVDLLNDLYTTFDAAIEQYKVYKVETIGDAYMVVSGLPMRTKDHAESIATMALHLLHLAGKFRVRHLPSVPLHLRIGLHTGPCCAGVVGLTMPRYCLFGDTVNTASRMESTGAAWRIQVSAATAERLSAAGGYRLRSRGLTQIKGKGAMHTYWLLGKDGFDKPLPTPPPLESEEVLFETDGENESEASAPPATPPKFSQTIERQRSDPSSTPDKYAWQRSGAVSADSSPPRLSGGDHSAPYSRYRCLAGGTRVLRRQWSLERGDVLAAAAAAPDEHSSSADLTEPLALLAVANASRAPLTRYRTRPDPEDETRARPP